MGDPLPLAFVGSQYIFYILPAFAAVAARIAARRFSRAETVLLGTYALCMGLEFLQLAAHGFDFFGASWGVARYFGVFSPLMWIWTAWAAARLWNLPVRPEWRLCARVAVALFVVWVVADQGIRQLHVVYTTGAAPDVARASEKIARVIRRDYAGPARQDVARRSPHEYFSTRRPVVFSDFGYAAWLLRGQSEGALHGEGFCPYPDDYLFIRVGSGYGRIEKVDSAVYDYVCTVRGEDTLWRLFRRRTTPHSTMSPVR